MNTLGQVIRYAITDSSRLRDAATRRTELVTRAQRWARQKTDFVQLREKTLEAGELLALAEAMLAVFREHGEHTKLLINGRADIAIAAQADGVHLPSHREGLTPAQVRQLYRQTASRESVVSMSCHSPADVERACALGTNLILFGPVFEKRVEGRVVTEGMGLEMLRQACTVADGTPLIALGGVTEENTAACIEAGAAGVAGIRLFFQGVSSNSRG
jgi:thiamine-phosphate pyrophosphorylase